MYGKVANIIKDYLYSNIAMEKRAEMMLRRVEYLPFYNEEYKQSLIDVFSTRVEYMNSARADDDDRFGGVDILIFRQFVGLVGLSFAVCLHAVAVQDILPGIDGTADNDGGAHFLGLDAQGLGRGLFQFRFRQFLTNLDSNLELFHSAN